MLTFIGATFCKSKIRIFCSFFKNLLLGLLEQPIRRLMSKTTWKLVHPFFSYDLWKFKTRYFWNFERSQRTLKWPLHRNTLHVSSTNYIKSTCKISKKSESYICYARIFSSQKSVLERGRVFILHAIHTIRVT